MRAMRLFVMLFCLATLSIAAEPLRVALPPSSWYAQLTPELGYLIPLQLHLQDRLAETPEVMLADEGWTSALLGNLAGGKRVYDESRLFAEFTASLPVDFLVQLEADANAVHCAVFSAQGVRRQAFPIDARPDVMAICEAAGAFLAKELALSPGAAKLLAERRLGNPAQFQALMLARRVYVLYPNNVAEARLKLLQPFIGTPDATNLAFAAGVLEALPSISNGRPTSSPAIAKTGIEMCKLLLPRVLGTDREAVAHAILREAPKAFAGELLNLVKPLSGDSLDLDLLATAEGDGGGTAPPVIGGDGPAPGPVTLAQRLGALRCLGVIQHPQALATITLLAKNEDPLQRLAAAEALRHYGGQAGLDLLVRFEADTDPRVAFAAAYGLWKRSAPDKQREISARALEKARRFTDDKDAVRRIAAREVLCAIGTKDDMAALSAWAGASDGARRTAATRTLLRLGALDKARWPALLRDPSSAIVIAALDFVPADADAAMLARLRGLANDPAANVAQAAGLACARFLPAEPRARRQMELAIAHPTIRKRIIDALATNPAPAMLEDLAAACTNAHPHARAYALAKLVLRDPALGRAALARAISDPCYWVRLHAAAALAPRATTAEAEAIRKALEGESESATRLYLADALAQAEGKPLPAPRPAARSISGRTNLTWLCGIGEGVATSPFGAYYCLNVAQGDSAARAQAAGKIVFGRATPVGNPGTLITDPAAMDDFWLALQGELTAGVLSNLDGVVYGEETMSGDIGALWANGWPIFCRDAGIDPALVRGIRTNLAPPEARAWDHWALTQEVEGFNALYDYTRLRFGKLRPGLQVCTFLPGQGMNTPADRQWKFDIAGVYDYKGNNRIAAYTLIRGMKTLWPDRPVLWMSLGIGGYEMNPVRYDLGVPAGPLLDRSDRAYADSLSAWLAGADTGFFSTWIFVDKSFKGDMHHLKGVQILAEDIVPGGRKLQSGIEYAFQKVDKVYRFSAEGGLPKAEEAGLTTDGSDVTGIKALELDEQKPEDDPILKRIADEKENMRLGFHFYGKYIYDCARAFASLPRLNPRPDVLAVRPGLSVWSRAGDFAAPGFSLLNAYDFLMDINLAAELDLARYRLIAVDALDGAPLTDAAIAALSGWLKAQPGVLYIRGSLSTNPANEASTAAHHDGKLQNRWPWAGEVALAPAGTYLISGGAAALAPGAKGPTLVLWRNPEFKGAVLFDCGTLPAEDLRAAINKLAGEQKIGVALTGPANQQIWREAGFLGAACAGGSVSNIVPGVDLLFGQPDPAVGPYRAGALIATNFAGSYAAALNGVVVLGERPLDGAAPVPGGLRVKCPGLLQAGSRGGAVTVAIEGGGALPAVGKDKFALWLLFGKEDGIYTYPYDDRGTAVTYIRSARPVVVTAK